MNNVIMRQVAVTAEYQALSPVGLIGGVTISCPPTNAQPVFFRGDDGSDVRWLPGQWETFRGVNLAEIFVKGAPGDVVTIVGGTWD